MFVPRLAAAPNNCCHRLPMCVAVLPFIALLLAAPSFVEELRLGPVAALPLHGRSCQFNALPVQGAREYLQFLSSRFSSPGDAAYAPSPLIDALTIRDQKDQASVAPR